MNWNHCEEYSVVKSHLRIFHFFSFWFIIKIAAKRDPAQDAEAQEWVESILGAKFPGGQAYEDVLKDGQVLCKLINKLKPGLVAKVNESGGQFKLMENINNFQKALKEYGVPDQDVFQTVDLWEKKDISQVTNTLFALGRAVSIIHIQNCILLWICKLHWITKDRINQFLLISLFIWKK